MTRDRQTDKEKRRRDTERQFFDFEILSIEQGHLRTKNINKSHFQKNLYVRVKTKSPNHKKNRDSSVGRAWIASWYRIACW